ncbi:uncharacterized protein LOC128271131 [Anopheles cruzii]|uniref:uncharacterized protein LOC128271131 n=1 Tax=Anopheles cruzii TaxID=68878 RepID=UPI0022EC2FF9|nr:uncharacterized protein LOC128271131 [Anopheles cruzii]
MSLSGVTIVTLVTVCLVGVRADNIRCFACDDCTKQQPVIVQCGAESGSIDLSGFRANVITTPMLTTSHLLTPPPLVGGGGGDPLLTPPPLVGGGGGDPLLTPPPLVGGGGGDPLLTPPYPILTPPPVYPFGKDARRMAQKRFVCVTVQSKGTPLITPPLWPWSIPSNEPAFIAAQDETKDLIHRRGCAEIEGHAMDVCRFELGPVDGVFSCRVCSYSLCNE